MSEENKNVLRKHRDELVQNLDPERVLDIPYSTHVLTDDDLSTINAGTTHQIQVLSLLDVLGHGDDERVQQFLAELKKTVPNALVLLLEPPRGKKIIESWREKYRSYIFSNCN